VPELAAGQTPPAAAEAAHRTTTVTNL